MTTHRVRNTVLVLVLLVLLAACAVLLGAFRHSSVASNVDTPLSAQDMQMLIPRGRELALAGDCFGCHSQAQGPRAAGGVPIPTPFGTLYSTNITPDPTHGIGDYTRADFHRVLRDGIAPGGRNLYPAMPFVYTQITTPADIDALYAYLMSIPPIPQPNVANTGVFAYPVRPFMNFWTLIDFPRREAPAQAERSDAWLRGGYLVEGLGHCGSCHTPRTFTMGTDFSRSLQGGEIDGYTVPDITAAGLSARGFDHATLSQYLQTGIAPQGTAFAGMSTVVHFSTSEMDASDVDAIATYLLTDGQGKMPAPAAPPAPLPEAARAEAGSTMASGRLAYLSACAGCHGAKGEGIPNVAPAMLGNTTLALDDPTNTLRVVLHGIPTQTFTGGQRMYAMPPFAHDMSSEDIAALVTWVRAEWGGQGRAVSPEQVEAISSPTR